MTAPSPLVTILVPAFNAELTIAATLRSALSQTYPNFEIVVVDDGSTDRTLAVANAFARHDARVRVICRVHQGVSAARNAGMEAGRGEFIAPLDADDLWHRDKLLRQVQVASQMPSGFGFVYCWFRRIDSEDNVVGSQSNQQCHGMALYRLLFDNFVGTGSSILFSRALAMEVGGYEVGNQQGEDYLFQLRLAARSPVGCVPAYLVGYRITPRSLSSDREKMHQAWRTLRRRLPGLFPAAPRKTHDWAHGRRCAERARVLRFGGRYRSAAVRAAEALWFDPVWTILYLHYLIARRAGRRRSADGAAPRPFDHVEPTERVGPEEPVSTSSLLWALRMRRMRHLAVLDAQS